MNILLIKKNGQYICRKFFDYDDKLDELTLENETLPCLHSDVFCKPTLKNPYTSFWFPEGICSIPHITDFTVRMSQLKIVIV